MLNIFNLRGPEFLQFYGVLLVIALAVGLFVRWWMRLPADAPANLPALDAFDISLLAGGTAGAMNAAIAALVQTGCLKVDSKSRKIHRGSALLPDATALQTALHQNCMYEGSRLRQLRAAAKQASADSRKQLEQQGLVLPFEQQLLPTLAPLLLMLAVLIIGIIKIFVGVQRGRAVGFLGMLCFFALFLMLAFFMRPVWRTRRGDRVLKAFRRRHAPLKKTAIHAGKYLSQAEVILAFALFGPAILSHSAGPLRDLYLVIQPPGEGGGSSGCGGGGCGGGGCGGCGG